MKQECNPQTLFIELIFNSCIYKLETDWTDEHVILWIYIIFSSIDQTSIAPDPIPCSFDMLVEMNIIFMLNHQ